MMGRKEGEGDKGRKGGGEGEGGALDELLTSPVEVTVICLVANGWKGEERWEGGGGQ